MDKVVVIGGAGFLGSHTADELTRRGYRVTIFDQIESPWLLGSQERKEPGRPHVVARQWSLGREEGSWTDLLRVKMMQCTRAKAGGECCVASTMVIIGIVLFLTKWMNGDTTTIDNDGDNNKFETKHEVSLLHIENLASGQRFTNLVMIGGFLVIVLLAGYSVFHSRTSKASRRKIKDLERAQLFDKIQAIEDEMVTRGFMAA